MSGNDKGTPSEHEGLSPEDRAAFARRAAGIGEKLDQAKGRQSELAAGPADFGNARGAAMSRSLRISTELLGGIVVGGFIGWALDKWLGNEKPWLFILFFILGATAGMLNVVRMASKERTPPAPSVRNDEDER